MDLHGDLLQTCRIYMVICFIYMVIASNLSNLHGDLLQIVWGPYGGPLDFSPEMVISLETSFKK